MSIQEEHALVEQNALEADYAAEQQRLAQMAQDLLDNPLASRAQAPSTPL